MDASYYEIVDILLFEFIIPPTLVMQYHISTQIALPYPVSNTVPENVKVPHTSAHMYTVCSVSYVGIK